ncbi:Proteasome activator BLM10 [Coemansia spiralis]|uniref:Proteasome activator BLM10 n=2 Tax=Coemansia TaxID=4863 RepID=A0A9W8G1R2_9FUNG|nr:Proteasome activator BLM10 [Coemansia umbellata]KAJ2619351.1 Proteasome activator BLM10 [Coemansia sp. RSA 1358]KAJ2669718.1 Proteasome activator BLM10 [Coemansia spiralis]
MRFEELNWSSLLPYDVGDESTEYERDFVAQFKRAALSGNYSTLSRLVVVLNSSYNNFSLPVRIQLCQVLYELILNESLDLTLLWDCCSTLTEILSKDDKITPDVLTLDWTGLYSMVKAQVFPKTWHDNPFIRSVKSSFLINLVQTANKFFDSSAAKDILQELLPQIQFNSYDWQTATIQLLYIFMPRYYLRDGTNETPGSAGVKGPEQWLPTLFSLWSFNLRAGNYSAYLLKIIASIAYEQKGCLDLTDSQIRFAFASGLHLFNLPLSRNIATLPRSISAGFTDTSLIYRLPKNGWMPISEEKAATFAKFIVYTLRDDSPGGTLLQFEQLVQMIEPFYHPSNNGTWSSILARFLRQLSKDLLQRTRDENKEDTVVPPGARLPRHIRRRFVLSIRTLAMMLLFSKGEELVSLSHSTLKYLAEVEPDLIFRPLLDTLYTAIDAVTETHRVISAIRALAKLAPTLSNFSLYPEGAQHVAPLLTLTLPGIDANDPTKAFFTLTFVADLCANGVVLEELQSTGDMPALATPSKTPPQSTDDVVIDESLPEMDMEQIEWITRASTAQFEAWIDQFLHRVFMLTDNMSSSLDVGNGTVFSDRSLIRVASRATRLVLFQCSERYHPMISRLITNFATSITNLSALESVCWIVTEFASAIPERAFASLLPMCCEKIGEEISNGVGSVPSLSKRSTVHSETTLIWYTSLLSAITESMNSFYLMKYKTQIVSTMNLLFEHCLSSNVYTTGGTVLLTLLNALTTVYPDSKDSGRSVPKHIWQDPEFHKNHFRFWGKHAPVPESLASLEWHEPTLQEAEFALELAHTIIVPRINELNCMLDKLSGKREYSNLEKVQLHRLLTILICGLRGISSMIPPNEAQFDLANLPDMLADLDSSNSMPSLFKLDGQVPAGYVFTDPESVGYKEVRQIRDSIGQVALKAMEHLATSNEDNVENIKVVIVLAEAFMCYYGVDKGGYEASRRSWNFGIDSFAIDYSTCVVPRYFAIRRVVLTQLARMLRNTQFMRVEKLHHDISSQLAHFCLSQYAEVRSYAVSAIHNVFCIIPETKFPLIPRFLAELEDKESSTPERMTGAIKALDVLPIRNLFKRNWKYLSKLALALCRAQHEDKQNVKKLIRDFALWHVIFVAPPLPIQELKPHTIELLQGLCSESSPQMNAMIASDREKCEQRIEFAKEEKVRLVNALIDITRDAGTTWRFAALAGTYLDQLTALYSPIEPRLATTLAEYVTSDLLLFRENSAMNLTRLLSKIRKRSKDSCPGISVNSRRITLKSSQHGTSIFNKQTYTDLCEQALASSIKNNGASEVSEPLVDNPALGWFAWPAEVKAYVQPPPGETMAYDHIDPGSQDAYEAVRKVMFADGKWDRIAKLFSLESARPPEDDVFGISRAFLYTELFTLFDLPLLEKAWPAIDRLARDFEHPCAQRAASELISGLLRGSKHWALGSLKKMWDKVVPLLSVVFSKLRPDSIRFWQRCLQFAFARRDPRRFLPLLKQIIYGRPFDPQSEAPFVEATKLELLRVLICCWDWRIASSIIASKPRLLEALAHPYQQVRDSAGVFMYVLSSAEFFVSYPKVDMAIEDLARYGPTGCDFSHWKGTPRTQTLIHRMIEQVKGWETEHVPSNEGTSNYSRGSKTLLTFFLAGFSHGSRRLAIDNIPSVLPLVSVLQEQHDDEDVSRMAKVLLQFFSQILYTPQILEDVATNILSLLDNSSNMWHVVTKMLPLLCTLTFANRFTLAQEMRVRIVDTTVLFLEHDQIEVRQAASASLTSLIKCASSKVISDINSGFSAKLIKRLPRFRNGKQPKNPAAYNRLILTRHAGVLGLSCLVLAFPYTIPDWMPEVLVQLSECIDDPNPIQATVQRTFAEFRRTHMDTWHEDRKKFTSDQLEILTDMLVSPCYYA